MTERLRDSAGNWIDPDDAPEWPDEVWDRAQISVGGKVVRPATGTLTKRGRPPVGDAPKQQVTLRLPRAVIEHFKARRRRLADPDQRGARAARRQGEAQVGIGAAIARKGMLQGAREK